MLNDHTGVCIERRLVAVTTAATRRDATLRCALSRRCALIRDYTSIVSVVCALHSTQELGIIFVKPLSAADRVRCAAMNRAFISPQNCVSISCLESNLRFDGRRPRESFGFRYSFSLSDAAFFEYAWNKVCIFQALFDYGTNAF